MLVRSSITVICLSAVCFTLACAEDKDPSLTMAPTVADSGDPGGDPGDDDATTSNDPTDDPTADPTADPTGGPTPQRVCELYLDCLAEVNPEQLPDAQQGFGADGTCWQGTPAEVEQCRVACENALEDKYEIYWPDEPACALCQVDSDCVNGSECTDGQCRILGCGDELVSDDEVCDSPGCDLDCQGPAACNPLSSAGCTAPEVCLFAGEAGVQCGTNDPTLPGDGEVCDPFGAEVGCAAGLVCAPQFIIQACPELGCCTTLCNLQGADTCTAGRMCSPLYETNAQANYVGACLPE